MINQPCSTTSSASVVSGTVSYPSSHGWNWSYHISGQFLVAFEFSGY